MQKIIKIGLSKTIGLYINLLSYIIPDKELVMAYGFFSEPREGKLVSYNLPEILKEAKQETISYGEKFFQTYTWQGNSNKILLVHGWESNSSRWKKLLPYLLKTGKTILSIDAPAHGLSIDKEFNVPNYADFINIVVEKYNPKVVIGHSLGGNTLSYFQAYYKNNFEKMILLGSPSDFIVILDNYIKMLGLNKRVHTFLKENTKKRFNFT